MDVSCELAETLFLRHLRHIDHGTAPLATSCHQIPATLTVESYIDATGECVAVSSRAAPYGVTATAQCCDLQGIYEVQLVEDSSSEIDVLVSNCPDDSQLMGCVAPGESCGSDYHDYVRVCFTSAPPDVVARGVDVLATLLGR